MFRDCIWAMARCSGVPTGTVSGAGRSSEAIGSSMIVASSGVWGWGTSSCMRLSVHEAHSSAPGRLSWPHLGQRMAVLAAVVRHHPGVRGAEELRQAPFPALLHRLGDLAVEQFGVGRL